MFNKSYKYFVRANSPNELSGKASRSILSGDEARRLYLEEIKDARPHKKKVNIIHSVHKEHTTDIDLTATDKEIFVIVQNNEVDKLKCILDKHHDKINIVDDYGWSLLMIACQANSKDTVRELLERNIDISVRDKAGNSARSLVIKNKNYELADILLKYKHHEKPQHNSTVKKKPSEEYHCHTCNKLFPDKETHLSSTLHNIVASKHKKMPRNYTIPTSNKGYQLMLKGGWDRDTGLGRDGSGRKYPIKPVMKKDRKGLGHKKIEQQQNTDRSMDDINHTSKKIILNKYKSNRQFEINFRREFY